MNKVIRGAIKNRLLERQVSQYKLAKDLNSTQPNISRMLAGRSGGIPKKWQELFDFLELELIAVPKKQK